VLADGPWRLITLDESERDPAFAARPRRDRVCPPRVPAGHPPRQNVLSLAAFRKNGGPGGSRTPGGEACSRWHLGGRARSLGVGVARPRPRPGRERVHRLPPPGCRPRHRGLPVAFLRASGATSRAGSSSMSSWSSSSGRGGSGCVRLASSSSPKRREHPRPPRRRGGRAPRGPGVQAAFGRPRRFLGLDAVVGASGQGSPV
jgi:hypothetical protein